MILRTSTTNNKVGAKAGCDVNALEAWKTCTGDPSIIVAILDEGVMYTHPDLAVNMWCNPGESVQGAQTDGDGNGYEATFMATTSLLRAAILPGLMPMTPVMVLT